MSAVPAGVSIIRFRDREIHGWYGIVLATKDDKAKVFRATPYDLTVMGRGEFTMMPENSVPKAARLWSESIRSAGAPEQVKKTLGILASLEEPGVQHA